MCRDCRRAGLSRPPDAPSPLPKKPRFNHRLHEPSICRGGRERPRASTIYNAFRSQITHNPSVTVVGDTAITTAHVAGESQSTPTRDKDLNIKSPPDSHTRFELLPYHGGALAARSCPCPISIPLSSQSRRGRRSRHQAPVILDRGDDITTTQHPLKTESKGQCG